MVYLRVDATRLTRAMVHQFLQQVLAMPRHESYANITGIDKVHLGGADLNKGSIAK